FGQFPTLLVSRGHFCEKILTMQFLPLLILNQNYVNGYMSSTIAWNLIASYYYGLPYYRNGLMTALVPWSGNYNVSPPIWIAAHTTQFTSIGWKYLKLDSGVGKLPQGGSYVGLISPDGTDLTIVIETITHNHSICIGPGIPWYDVHPQHVTLSLKGSFAKLTSMNVWYSKLGFNGQPNIMFRSLGQLKFVSGQAVLKLGLDEVYTLTTISTGQKGSYPDPPPSQPFPLPYLDDFEGYPQYQEPFNLAQQTGSYEPGVILICTTNHLALLVPILARTKITQQGSVQISAGWHTLSLLVQGASTFGALDGVILFNATIPTSAASGFAAIGTDSYGLADFDNLLLESATKGLKIVQQYTMLVK
ncbi:galactocerebrosidase isoform X2, partial [Biomphalaria glabrata]